MGERLGDPINIVKSGQEPIEFTAHIFGWEYPKNVNPQVICKIFFPIRKSLTKF